MSDIDEHGYRLVNGYKVKDVNLNGKTALEIIVSDTKRIVTQALKMSEQFDLFELLSASENGVYRTMASLAASVRAMGSQPIGQPVQPKFFPKHAADIRAVLDDLDEDGVNALLEVQKALAESAANPDPVAVAKN